MSHKGKPLESEGFERRKTWTEAESFVWYSLLQFIDKKAVMI
jgi:hypothetical protein